MTEPVIMEVVAGARSEAHADKLRRLLLRGGLLPFDPPTDFDAAALIYRRCRQAGITPRGMIDCMIAAVAWRQRATLLCRDVDLEPIIRSITQPKRIAPAHASVEDAFVSMVKAEA